MTEEIFNRGINRELTIWAPFVYNGPFTTDMEADRAVIFGLYAATYLHGFNYLNDITAEDLAQLLDQYTTNMNQIDIDSQTLVLEIAAKRYVKQIEIRIHDVDLTGKRKNIDAENQGIDIKIAALSADQAGLTTKQTQIDAAIEAANLRIQELEQMINLETVNQSLVDVEIAEKQLQAARTELKVLSAALEALNIQLSIVNIGLEKSRTQVQATEYQADIAMIYAEIIKRRLASEELELDQAELDALIYRIEAISAGKQLLQKAQKDTIKNIISDVDNQADEAQDLNTVQLGEVIEQISARKDLLDSKEDSALITKDINVSQADTREEIAGEAAASHETIADKRTGIHFSQKWAALWEMHAAIDAATYLAAANIQNILLHYVSVG